MTTTMNYRKDTLGYHHVEGNFVALRAGTLWLLLKQSEVQSAEQFSMLPDMVQVGEASGLFVSTALTPRGEKKNYYVALSKHLNLLSELPKKRFLITKLKGSDLHWCWDEVKVLPRQDLSEVTIPPVLKTPETKLDTMVFFENKQGFLYSVKQLMDVLPQNINRIID